MPELKMERALDVEAGKVETKGAENVTVRWLISKGDGAPNFAMRLFEVEPGGHSPLHRHDSEHEIYILEGKGVLTYEGEEKNFSRGYFIYVPPGALHSFRNTGKEKLRFLCMVPNT